MGGVSMFTRWSDTLLVGVTFIDREHKEIIKHSEKLHDLLLQGNYETYIKELPELLNDYVNRHLAHEEELQKMIGFHLFEEHIKHHDEFREWAEEIKTQVKSNDLSEEEIRTLDISINDWLIKHIQTEDIKIGEYHDVIKANMFNPYKKR